MNIINQYLPQVQQVMRRYNVQAAYSFGSAVKGTMREEGDVGFIIRFPQNMSVEAYADNNFSLAHALENLLNKKVELLAEETLYNL